MTTLWTEPAIDPSFRTLPGDDPDVQLRRWRVGFAVVLVAGVAAWAVGTYLVAPPLIRSGYADSSSLSIVNGAFDHRSDYPLDHYLRKWNRLALGALAAWVGVGLLLLGTTSRAFAQRMVGTATPGTLGAIRALVCLVLAVVALFEPVTTVLSAMPADRTSMGFMDFLYASGKHARGLPVGFDALVRSAAALMAFKAVTVAALLAGAIGWKTRAALTASAVLCIALLGILRSHSWMSHTGLVPIYVLLVLTFTRCGDGWSLDRWLKVRSGEPVPPADLPAPHYAWARYAVWVVIVMTYVAAGLCKLFNDDWRWWQGINLQRIILAEGLRAGEGYDFMLRQAWVPTWAFTVLGVMTLVIELGIALVLVSRTARRVFPLLAAAMHVGILVLQNIPFLDLIVIQVVFYDWTPLGRAIGKRTGWRAARSAPAVPVRETRSVAGRLTGPLVVTALACFFAVVWARRIEWYPFSSVGMFSTYDASGVITYYKVYATDARGRTYEAPLDRMGRTMGRYRPILSGGFHSESGRRRCVEMLQFYGSAHNAAHPKNPIVRLEVHRRVWDFVNHRKDPHRGATTGLIPVAFTPVR